MSPNPTGWQDAASTPEFAPYAKFISARLLAELSAGQLDQNDFVVLALRLESATTVTTVLNAKATLPYAVRQALTAGPPTWPQVSSAAVRLKDLSGVIDLVESVAGLVLVDIGQVLPGDAWSGSVEAPPVTPAWATTADAIVAVIDDGFALGHARFRDQNDMSRFAAVWVMDGAAKTSHAHGYGRVYHKAELDSLIAAATGPGGFDDGRFSSLSGLVDHRRDLEETVARAVAHGTGVLDLFAGYSASDRNWDGGVPRDAAANAPIIAVQFPSAQARDTSGAGLRAYIRDAIEFVLAHAARISGPNNTRPPVVINLSYGLMAGPHDGTHQVERDIQELLGPEDKVHLVLPSGNAALAQGHARLSAVPTQETRVVEWQIHPDDRTPSFLEIWARGSDGAGLEVRLETPGGVQSGWVKASGPDQVLGSGIAVVRHVHQASIGQGHGFLVALAPSFDLTRPDHVVPSGLWRVHVRNASTAAMDVDCWVQRDVGPYGSHRLGRQSYLHDARYERFDEITDVRDRDTGPSHVVREGTISAMATGSIAPVTGGDARLHVIGGWQGGADRRPAVYSSRSLKGARVPKMAAQSECSRVHAGQLTATTSSAGRVALGGTSVAAPQYARALLARLVAGHTTVVPDQLPGDYEIKPGVVAPDGTDRVGAGSLDPVHVPDPSRRL